MRRRNDRAAVCPPPLHARQGRRKRPQPPASGETGPRPPGQDGTRRGQGFGQGIGQPCPGRSPPRGTSAGKVSGKRVCLHLLREVESVISIAMLSGGKRAAEYYLDRDADCGARYYTDTRLDAGYWCGGG